MLITMEDVTVAHTWSFLSKLFITKLRQLNSHGSINSRKFCHHQTEYTLLFQVHHDVYLVTKVKILQELRLKKLSRISLDVEGTE